MKKILMMVAVCLMAAATFAAQCAATTKKGTQCKRQASPGSEFCWQHGGTTKSERAAGQSSAAPSKTTRRAESSETVPVPATVGGQCAATTKAGTRCKRKAQAGSRYCFQHAAMADGGTVETPAAPVAHPEKRAKPKKAAEAAAEEAPAAATSAETGICQGKTKSGEPCKRKAKPGSKFCWQHEKQ
ncbi:MAG: hypothetical protein IJH50_13650 [Kiritimatiellae bacterium]|nr:hypothetical protein [Kiritimatiellia bacterium]